MARVPRRKLWRHWRPYHRGAAFYDAAAACPGRSLGARPHSEKLLQPGSTAGAAWHVTWNVKYIAAHVMFVLRFCATALKMSRRQQQESPLKITVRRISCPGCQVLDPSTSGVRILRSLLKDERYGVSNSLVPGHSGLGESGFVTGPATANEPCVFASTSRLPR